MWFTHHAFSNLAECHRRGEPIVDRGIKSRYITCMDEVQQYADESLVTVIFRSLINERKIDFFMNVYFTPYTLAINGIVFPDMLVSKRGTILYKLQFDRSIITRRFGGVSSLISAINS